MHTFFTQEFWGSDTDTSLRHFWRDCAARTSLSVTALRTPTSQEQVVGKKIDMSFVDLVDFAASQSRPSQLAIPRAIILLAKSMGLITAAEAIETVRLHHLTALGADLAQGFYFSKPLLECDALSLLKSHQS